MWELKVKRSFCLFMLIFLFQGCLEQCENLVVLNKSKCTFDREHLARVCVVRLGDPTKMKSSKIRGRVSATYLPEPLMVGETKVRVCTRQGRKYFEKL